MPAEKNEAIAKAYERLQVLSQDEKKRMEYEAREKSSAGLQRGDAGSYGAWICERNGCRRGNRPAENAVRSGKKRKAYGFGRSGNGRNGAV